MTAFVHEVWWVARYEVGEGLRTRLFQLALLGYLGGIGVANWILVKILSQMEAGLATTMGLPPTERPGAMMNTLLADGRLNELIAPIVGGTDAATTLLTTPVAALWGGAAAMALLPVLLVFGASGSVAGEVQSRSIRYLACRTGRLQIGLGKLAGQLLLTLLAAALGVVLSVALTLTLMVGNDPVTLFTTLSIRTGWALAYAVPFAALALAASQVVANPNGARFLAAAVLFGMPILANQLDRLAGVDLVGRLCDMAGLFLATSNWVDLWSPDPATAGTAALRGLVLGILYFSVGFWRFNGRDL